MRQDLAQEELGPFALGIGEEGRRWRALDDGALIHEDDLIGDLAGEGPDPFPDGPIHGWILSAGYDNHPRYEFFFDR